MERKTLDKFVAIAIGTVGTIAVGNSFVNARPIETYEAVQYTSEMVAVVAIATGFYLLANRGNHNP